MLLTVDSGNSRLKAALFNSQGELSKHFHGEELFHWLKVQKTLPQTILSQVGAQFPKEYIPYLKNSFVLPDYYKENKFLGMPVSYGQGLGEDRLIAAYEVFSRKTGPLLLIDAGTFITIDLVTPQGFLGGWIFPGESPYFLSYQQGLRLPIVKQGKTCPLPRDTQSAIAGSFEVYIQGIVQTISQKTQVDNFLFTGGSARFIQRFFPKQYPLEKDLIHWGLYRVANKLRENL